MRIVEQETREPCVRRAVADFGGAGLGAEIQPRETVRAVVRRDVVVHHVAQLVGGRGAEQICARAAGRVEQQRRLDDAAAVGNGRDVAQHGVRADEVLILTDTRPGEIRAAGRTLGEAAGHRRDAAQRLGIEEAEFFRIALDGVRAELERDLRERAVAGVCQRILERLAAVHARALDGHAADVNTARTGEAAGADVLDVLERGGGGDELVDRARRERAVDAAVDVCAVRHVAVNDRVDARSGDHAQHLARLVIAHEHGALAPGERLVGRDAQTRIKRERDGVPVGRIGAGDGVIA